MLRQYLLCTKIIFVQDYLNENFHRLQGIYKPFWGGFLQPTQVLLASKKIKFDPTKRDWKWHEYHVMKIFFAIQSILSRDFFEQADMKDLLKSIVDEEVCVEEGLWKLQTKYHGFVELLEEAQCETCHVVMLFTKVTRC